MTVTQATDPPVARAGQPLTYTLRVTNTGNVTLTATITDHLPDHTILMGEVAEVRVSASGVLTWGPVSLAPGAEWMVQFVVAVDAGYEGPLENEVTVDTVEGASQESVGTVEARQFKVYLPSILRTFSP
jgi:uncharacterized repeat protein (TIGR01451 family)